MMRNCNKKLEEKKNGKLKQEIKFPKRSADRLCSVSDRLKSNNINNVDGQKKKKNNKT